MEKFTQKQLRGLVAAGAAIDIAHAISRDELKLQSGKLYAITARPGAIYIF